MPKSKIPIVMHQLAGRSRFFARYSKKKNKKVFWPGCAALTLGPDAINSIYHALCMSLDEEIGFSSLCCGKPSYSILGKRMRRGAHKQLHKYFRQAAPDTIYTLCPNCKITLEERFHSSVQMLWNAVDSALWTGGNIFNIEQAYIHDPCPTREDICCHKAVRLIGLNKGIEMLEPVNTGSKTLCCGRKDMLFIRDTETSEQILQKRISQFQGKAVITYCESCVQSFKEKGVQAYHIIEIITGKKYTRSWKNRFKAVQSLWKLNQR